MNCSACGAPLHPNPVNDSLVCDYCKSVYFPPRNDDGVVVLGPAQDEVCPVCATGLQQATLERTAIRYCAKCRGMLIPMGSFPELIESLRAKFPGRVDIPAVDPRELDRKLTCPQCRKPMIVDFYPAATNVVIGSCERCALDWVDHGKMQRIVDGARVIREQEEHMVEGKLQTDLGY
ncbi:MAG TPA: zf-TFIIB domain-containing protein [Acidobacteriaceae bacterium]